MLAVNGLIAKGQDVSVAKWAAKPATVDGSATEWVQPLNFYDNETRLLFAISNDSTNIYLCFESKEEQTQRKILKAGMVVELITKGKGSRSTSVAFPLSPKERESEEDDGPGNESNENNSTANHRPTEQVADAGALKARLHAYRQRFLTNNITMKLQGFAFGNGIVPVRGKEVSAAINWDDAGNMFYEIAIPVKYLLDGGYSAKQLSREITLKAAINAMPQKSTSGKRFSTEGEGFGGGFGGKGMRGGGMPGGGGMRGGGMPGSADGADKSNMNQKTSFKQKFLLNSAAQ